MFGGMRLGRVAGVPVVIHWTAAVMFAVIVLGLAEVILPDRVAGYGPVAYWLAGLGGGLLFLASLLVHELAHAVVARRHQVPVKQLGLWLLGGAAELEAEAPTPRAELRIAAAGPVASVAAAGGLALVAIVVGGLGLPAVAVTVLAWLAAVNLVLALFNLLPGTPLDGGRILRAALWARHGDRHRATMTAARAGRVVGGGAIGFGVAELVIGASVGGLWTILLGWFLLNAARAEAAGATAERALAGLRVADVLVPEPATVPGWISLEAFVTYHARRARHGRFPVEGFDGRIVGLVTLADVKAQPRSRWPELAVSAVMRPLERVPVAAPTDDLTGAVERMRAAGPAAILLVIDRGELVGTVSPAEVAWAVDYGTLAATAWGDTAARAPHPAADQVCQPVLEPTDAPTSAERGQGTDDDLIFVEGGYGTDDGPASADRGHDTDPAASHQAGEPVGVGPGRV